MFEVWWSHGYTLREFQFSRRLWGSAIINSFLLYFFIILYIFFGYCWKILLNQPFLEYSRISACSLSRLFPQLTWNYFYMFGANTIHQTQFGKVRQLLGLQNGCDYSKYVGCCFKRKRAKTKQRVQGNWMFVVRNNFFWNNKALFFLKKRRDFQ